MRVAQVGPAVALAVLLGATWAVPAALSAAVANPTTTVAADEIDMVQAPGGSELHFRAPAGWQQYKETSHSDAHYSSPDGPRLTVSIIDGSRDFDTSADRVLRQLSGSGIDAAFDGGRVDSPSGFTGKTCVVVNSGRQTHGNCAVVHREGLIAAVTVTRPGDGPLPDLNELIDSFHVDQEGNS